MRRVAKGEGQRKRGNHTADEMLRALLAHREGASLRQAAMKNNIKFVTLRRYAVKYAHIKKEELKNQRLTPNYTINRIFTGELEEMLKTFLEECAQKLNGITNNEIRRVAYEMAAAYKLVIPEAWNEKKVAGLDWFRSFRERNREFSPKKPQNHFRADSIDVEAVKAFCDCHKIEVQTRYKPQYVSVKDFKVMAAAPDEGSPSLEVSKIEEDESSVSLWSYFEREPNGCACCAICRSVVSRAQMKAHMQEHHPKLIFDTALESDGEASDTQEDVYTEIVYLEDEAKGPTPTPKKKKRESVNEKLPEPDPKPRKRQLSTSSEEQPLKRKAKKDDEIEHFAKYITCLLNKLPTEACMELQMEIVNLIMKKQLELKKKEAEARLADVERNGESSRFIDMDSSAT